MLLKAELHCHIEGAASPALVKAQARKYGADISSFIRGGAYYWQDFTTFLLAYDQAASLFRTQEDYALLAETYLKELAAGGAIYSEFFTSPDHAERAGLSPQAYTDGLAEGMVQAKAATGIESRMIVTGVRHFGPEAVEKAARFAASCEHPLVTGFGMAGDERAGHPRDFAYAFDIAREAGLGISIHAGEFGGAESVEAALDHIRPSRIGHGVRAIENPDLVRRIADEGVVLEVCPVSNVVLKVFPEFARHPFPQLVAAGCRVTLNSDDPPHFHTSLAREYAVAAEYFGLDETTLNAITSTAIEAAFVDEKTRAALFARLKPVVES
ncbi:MULTISPECIES: adenosine deaminase [Chelativorans]|jgi:adenosine deaminase|uniref:Adenine deaminase n=1 Tax=Chelativorans sp. (strain BNC1) TaxID=266779 RepID=ADE_CHESB|nr:MULTISPECIES: adenosine deaminase [Chelativorans]Q11C48.1 RecName: Full=Adenine deaminase; Short=ADE; AltName: Full=Adenine aminohydrolase; Short=AAH [Chelativorans sp. BNC1]